MELQFIFDPKHKETLSGRVRTACLTCRRRKTKCDGMIEGDLSCRICREKGIECEGFPKRKRPQRASKSGDDHRPTKRQDKKNEKGFVKRIDPRLRHDPDIIICSNKSRTTKPPKVPTHPILNEPLLRSHPRRKSAIMTKPKVVESRGGISQHSSPVLDLDMLSQEEVQGFCNVFETCTSDSDHTDLEQGVMGSQSSDWEYDLWPILEHDRRGSSSSTSSDASMHTSQLEKGLQLYNSGPAKQQHALARRAQPPIIHDLTEDFLVGAPIPAMDSNGWPDLSTPALIGDIPLGWEEGGKTDVLADFPGQQYAADQNLTLSGHARHPSLADYDGTLFAWPER